MYFSTVDPRRAQVPSEEALTAGRHLCAELSPRPLLLRGSDTGQAPEARWLLIFTAALELCFGDQEPSCESITRFSRPGAGVCPAAARAPAVSVSALRPHSLQCTLVTGQPCHLVGPFSVPGLGCHLGPLPGPLRLAQCVTSARG